jgi:hypothetical protein
MSYDDLSCVSKNLLKFYQLFTGEERRIPIIFDDFHFCRSRVMIDGFATICAISAYHHLHLCEFESCSWRGVLDTILLMARDIEVNVS